jgi:catechol 2,3-dioxygenase-like lactoylglutathione lyase family enzyme
MEHIINKLLRDFEEGKMSRRQLVQSLALAATAAAAAPANAAGSGFKAVTVNHISYQCVDYAKTRDFYADLLGMGIKQDNGRQCYMTFGDTFLLPRNRRTPAPNSDAAAQQKKSNRPPRPPVTALVDHIAYTIEDWDKEKVHAELEKRGLNPRPDTDDSFHVFDPDGFDLQISGKNMKA